MKDQGRDILLSGIILCVLAILALWAKSLDPVSSWQRAGMADFTLGFVLLAAYVSGRLVKTLRMPMISGYVLAGILAGPFVSGFLTREMTENLKLFDDLALSFIALSAGGTLHVKALGERFRSIFLNVILQTVIVFSSVFGAVWICSACFGFTAHLSRLHIISLAVLLGVVAIARSPSSAIAIISECRASGPFTETVLGVTIVIDVIIIVLFTLAMTAIQMFLSGGPGDFSTLIALCGEILVSLVIGALIGLGISFYISRAGHDLTLFLLLTGFAVTRISQWLGGFMLANFQLALHLEPLLICMSAGFVVQNFGHAGFQFIKSLDRAALPVFVLFFSLAGASLDLNALKACWPMALFLVVIRGAGIGVAAWTAGRINRDPSPHLHNAWMSYLTQAGVAIGLAQLAQRQFPEIGIYLTTMVLAAVAVNQLVGPILFKIALERVNEAGTR
ncbi:MAG: cation:proton antiporter [Desulfobacterales bacterium]|jgi:Kef-type K+ transport system membrane component KefB|nr:cation:proton antiporter [Desulfobacterales bacterium]